MMKYKIIIINSKCGSKEERPDGQWFYERGTRPTPVGEVGASCTLKIKV